MSPSPGPSDGEADAERADLLERHERLSLERFLASRGVPRLGFVLGVSVGLPLLWVAADALASVPVATPAGLPAVIGLGLLVVTSGALYIDRGLPTAIAQVGDVLEERSEYYRLMGEFVRRLYRPGKQILWLFVPVSLSVASVLVAVSDATGPVDFALVGVIAAVSSAVLSAYAWVTLSIGVYMGWRLRRFTVRLDVTKSHDNLGLRPYSEFVFRALLINMTGYALVAAYAFFFAATPLLVLFLASGTAFAVLWFVGSQYGLHRAIVASKRRRLDELRREYGDEIQGWFTLGEPNPAADDLRAADRFLAVKREIEEIPEWPSSTVQFVRAAGVAAAANAVASLPVFL